MSEPRARPTLILASTSPYRAQLLDRLGLAFDTMSPDIDESAADGETGSARAVRLARAKAAAIAARRPNAIVIGADQVSEFDGRLMGKPGGRERAIAQLVACRGREVVFHTAVAACRAGECHHASVPTTVLMRHLDRAAITRYVDIDRPFDCAGAMRSEALGISLAARITSDDPTALIGLPLTAVVALLDRFGVALP